MTQTQDPGLLFQSHCPCLLDRPGPYAEIFANGLDIDGRLPTTPLFTKTNHCPVAKRARSVAGCALLSSHKPTSLVQLPTNPTAPLPTFHPV